MGTFFSLLLILALLVGGVRYTLRIFSRLTAVDMPAAFKWGFKAKRYELVLTFLMFYLMAFVMILVMVIRPVNLLEIKTTHVGGLLGYQSGESEVTVYDPVTGSHTAYEMYPPPATPTRFNETFRIVSFYRPFFRSHYQNTEHLGLGGSLFLIFIGALGVVLTYLVLYSLAGAYVNKHRLAEKVTHQIIAARFRNVLKIRFTRALWLTLGILAILVVISGRTVSGVMRGYQERLASDQQALRDRLETSLSPGDRIEGRVIRRFYRLEKYYRRANTRRPDKVVHYRIWDFIVEFKNVSRVPVYLRLSLPENDENSPALAILGAAFEDDKATVPGAPRNHEFIVNENRSISLATQDRPL